MLADDPSVLADDDAVGIGMDLDRSSDRAGGHRAPVVLEAHQPGAAVGAIQMSCKARLAFACRLFDSLFKTFAVLCTQRRCPRVFGHTSSIAFQKPSAPSATASCGEVVRPRRLRSAPFKAGPLELPLRHQRACTAFLTTIVVAIAYTSCSYPGDCNAQS